MMKRNLFCALFGLAAAALPASAADGWVTDFEAAKKTAAKEGKDLLLDFTGSDWCGWCIRLKKEVFDHEAFKKGVADKYVLVELDFPQDQSKITDEERKQNEKLAELYGVEGYPTIVLADAKGRPYGKTGYEPGGPEAYVEHLAGFRDSRVARDKAFEEAGALEGVEKAKALASALDDLDDAAIDQFYPDVVKQILAADAKDESGFKEGRDYRQAVREYETQIEGLFVVKQYGSAINLAETFIEKHDPAGEDKQHILMAKVMAHVETGKKDEAFKVIEEIRKAAPESELSSQLDDIKVRIEEYIKEKQSAPAEEAPPAPKGDEDAPAKE